MILPLNGHFFFSCAPTTPTGITPHLVDLAREAKPFVTLLIIPGSCLVPCGKMPNTHSVFLIVKTVLIVDTPRFSLSTAKAPSQLSHHRRIGFSNNSF